MKNEKQIVPSNPYSCLRPKSSRRRRLFAAGLTLGLAFLFQSARTQPALVGEWLTNNSLADDSGYSLATNHGAFVIGGGNYVFTNDVPIGKTGQSILFTVGDTGLAISNSSTLDANYDNTFDDVIQHAFTVSCWARNFPVGWSPFVSKWGEGPPYNTPNGGWQLRAEGNGQDACFTVRDNNAGVAVLAKTGDALDDMASSGYPNNDGQWHFYMGTFDALTGVRSLYTDGQLSAQETNNVPYDLAAFAHLCIGAKDTPPGSAYGNFAVTNLEIYDVRIYNYALTNYYIVYCISCEDQSPFVNGQPLSTTTFPGATAKFAATVSGTTPLAYQWQLNGTNINDLLDSANFIGANSNVLTIVSATTNDAGSYHLIVTNLYGAAVSSNAFLTIDQPALVGEWLTNNSLADVSGYSPAGTHDGYDAAGTGGYVFTNDVPPGRSGYSLKLDGTTAIAISNSATSDANYTNTFDDTIANAMTVAFWAKGFPGGWTYFVSKNGDSGSPNAGWNIRRDGWNSGNNACWTMRSPGGTVTVGAQPMYGDTDDLGTSGANINAGGWNYYAGTYNKSTGVRSLYVDGQLVAQMTNCGAYTLAPYSHVVIGGFEGWPGGSINNFLNTTFYDVRIYNYVAISNGIVGPPFFPDPLISVQPASQTGYIGGKITFTPTIVGTAPFTNQWQLNGTNLVDGAYGGAYITGSQSNVLTIIDLTTNLQGSYQLFVSNSKGSTVSSNATLTVVSSVAPPAGNLVGEWFTNNSLADVSGYSPAGTHDAYGVAGAGVASSAYRFTNDVPPGATGNSLWLYAGSTAMAISNSSTLDASYTNTFDDTLTNAFTVTCWAKGLPGAWYPFVSKFGEDPGWQLRVNGSGNTPCWTIRGTNNADMSSTIGAVDTGWHFYAANYDQSTGIRNLYVDGVLAAQQTGEGPYDMAPVEHLAIGGKDWAPGNNFGFYLTGEIFDVRIYNTALSQAQTQPGPIPVPRPGPGPIPPPILNGNQLVLTYPSGTLLEATNLAGPWTPVAGATSPYTNNVTVAPQMFFKLQ